MTLKLRAFDDKRSCWHGKSNDCNINNVHYYGQNCEWWHFYPYQNSSDLQSKFDEIVHMQYSYAEPK